VKVVPERERWADLRENMPRIKRLRILRRLVHDPCRHACWREREYLFFTTYSRSRPEEDFAVRYDAPGEFFFCPVHGHLQSCEGCPDWGDNECTAAPERVSEEALRGIVSSLGDEEEADWELFES